MIKKIFKITGVTILIGILAIMILGTISQIILRPEEKKAKINTEIYLAINRINQECPMQVGAYIYMTNVSFLNDTICYHYDIKYDDEGNQYYSENPHIIHYLTKLGFIINIHYNHNKIWANFLKEHNFIWKLNIKTNSDVFSVHYNSDELISALKEMTTEEAIQAYLDATIFQMNQYTPFVLDEDGNFLSSIEVNSFNIGKLSKKYQLCRKVHLEGKDLVYETSIPEIQCPISVFENLYGDSFNVEQFLKELSLDKEFRDQLTFLALAKCNLVYRYYGIKSKRIADIRIPYSMIRKYTYIPMEFLEKL